MLAAVLSACAADVRTHLGWAIFDDVGVERIDGDAVDASTVDLLRDLSAGPCPGCTLEAVLEFIGDTSVHLVQARPCVRNGVRGRCVGDSFEYELQVAHGPCWERDVFAHELTHWVAWRVDGRRTADHPDDLFGPESPLARSKAHCD